MTGPRFIHPSQTLSREHHIMPYYECWSCGQPANHHCGPAEPVSGDVLICLNCTDPSVFDQRGIPRAPNPEAHAGIIADPAYQSFADVIRKANLIAMAQDEEHAHE